MEQLIRRLMDERQKIWDAAKALNDLADTENRDMTAEETVEWDRQMVDLDRLDKRISELHTRLAADRSLDLVRSDLDGWARPADSGDKPKLTFPETQERTVRAFLTGETRAIEIRPEKPITMTERRTLSKLTAGAGANTVRISFYEQLVAHLIEVSGILMAGPTVLTTTTGEAIQVPKTTAHSAAALTAEAAAIAASDPVFGQVTLDAFKYAVLIQVANELATDTSVDLMGYLAMQCGRAVGNAFGAHAVTGTGSGQPNGALTASTLGVTGGAGVGGAFTADNLIDLMFSVIAPYRNSPSCGWMVKDASLASIRKLKDGQGMYIWQPTFQVGEPDMLLGKPVYTDPNMPAVALAAKSVLFGDFSQYFVREVAGMRWERSEDFAFNTDLTTFRCILRADGDLVDTTGALKHFIGNAA